MGDEQHGLIIAGRRQAACSGEVFDVLAPEDERLLAQVARAGADDVELAVTAARSGSGNGRRWLPVSARRPCCAPPPVRRADYTERRFPTTSVANDSEFGLSAAVLTHNIQWGFKAARGIHAGSVHIGMHAFQSNALAPISGFGMSGIGRGGGRCSTEEFTEVEWVSVSQEDPGQGWCAGPTWTWRTASCITGRRDRGTVRRCCCCTRAPVLQPCTRH